MEDEILKFSPTLMFRGTPCIIQDTEEYNVDVTNYIYYRILKSTM